MRLAVTGGGGFIGGAVARRLLECGFERQVRLFDRVFSQAPAFETVSLDLTDEDEPERIVADADCIIHLASLPGDAAEADPHASHRANLDASLALIERARGRRLIFASSIAVFGNALPPLVDDDTPAVPSTTYGTHKRMVELAFADAVRREDLHGLALRLPGVVARPHSAEGFGSSFLSEIFHAAKRGDRYTVPVAPKATSWLMSARICAANLVDAALSSASDSNPTNLPALRVEIGELVRELGRAGNTAGLQYCEDPRLRRAFGCYPPLVATRSVELGFRSDGDLAGLVANVLADG